MVNFKDNWQIQPDQRIHGLDFGDKNFIFQEPFRLGKKTDFLRKYNSILKPFSFRMV